MLVLQSKHDDDRTAFLLEDRVVETGGNSDPLFSDGLIRDHATAGRRAQGHSVEHLARGGVQCQQVAVQSRSEDQSGSSHSNTSYPRLRSFPAPSDNAGIGIDGCDPAFLAFILLTKRIC